MSNVSGLLRALVIYGCCIPLAVVVGYLLATPLDPYTVGIVGDLLIALMIPLFLRWHHPWLIASWTMVAVLPFIPGRPPALDVHRGDQPFHRGRTVHH